MEMASRKIETYQNIKPRICVLFILCLTWTMNAKTLKQNIIVIKGGDLVYRKVAAKNIFHHYDVLF